SKDYMITRKEGDATCTRQTSSKDQSHRESNAAPTFEPKAAADDNYNDETGHCATVLKPKSDKLREIAEIAWQKIDYKIEACTTGLSHDQAADCLGILTRAMQEWGDEQLREIVRLIGGIFVGDKSLLGGSPPPMWSPHMIAGVIERNI